MLRHLLASICVVLAGTGAAAGAETPGGAVFAKRMFAGAMKPDKSYACFVRRYDEAHLARHPKQKVSRMKLLVTAEKVPEDAVLNYSFRLGVNFRHRPGDFDSSGECGHARLAEGSSGAMDIGCSVDCDGGGLIVGMSERTDAAILRLPGQVRIWERNSPDDEASDALHGGADDRIFRLDRADLIECRALVSDRAELAALRRK